MKIDEFRKLTLKDLGVDPVVNVSSNEPLGIVRQIVAQEHRHFVVTGSQSGQLGIITDADILKAAAIDDRAPASSIANVQPVTIDVNKTVDDAATLMKQSGHEVIPVVDSGRVVGVITSSDIRTKLRKQVTVEL
jgi:CBS domain-containing protein